MHLHNVNWYLLAYIFPGLVKEVDYFLKDNVIERYEELAQRGDEIQGWSAMIILNGVEGLRGRVAYLCSYFLNIKLDSRLTICSSFSRLISNIGRAMEMLVKQFDSYFFNIAHGYFINE